ncbi:MAG: glycosyltransferase family 2 protein, partial [Candidatus Odinarchaeota archaeon]
MRKLVLTGKYKLSNLLLLITVLATPIIILKIVGVSLIFFFSIIFGYVTPIILYFITGYNLLLLALGYFKTLFKSENLIKSFNLSQLPVVSIIVPVKNEEKSIGRLLKRLVELNYPKDKLEIIIVEGASTDNTKLICESYTKKYDYIRLYSRDKSFGKPDAIRFGCEQAKGEVVGFLDADNLPEKDLLIKAVCGL